MEHADEIEICRTDIALGGFSVAAIIADETGCDWAYTIGLHHSYGHPELLLVGLEAPIAGAVIEVVARTVAEGRVIRAGDEFTLDGGLELRAHAVDDLWCGMGDWFNLGREVMSTWGQRWPESLQLVWSDAEGRYPERPGDPRWSFRQPLLTGV
ncbi:MAG TPA: DUF4262 domain-containing protein [Microthrixaceae bacterium]|nr:DUF4262 domain-containing protein [Microthrixaceae bacterium]